MKRRIPSASVVACGLIVFAFSATSLQGAGQSARATNAAAHSEAAATLRQDMRKLWTDHVVWTRDYIIAAIADRPDAKAAADRLIKNQQDIGNAMKFYSAPAGQQLTTLLKEHITIAVDLIKAEKAGDKAAQQQADTRWQQNAVQIADFLSVKRIRTGPKPR